MRMMQLQDLKGIQNEVLEQADVVISLDASGNGVLLKHRYRAWPTRLEPDDLLAMLTTGVRNNSLIVVTNQGFMARGTADVLQELEQHVEELKKSVASRDNHIAAQSQRLTELETKIEATNVKLNTANIKIDVLEKHR